MGYMRHHAILVTAYEQERASEAQQQAVALMQGESGKEMRNGGNPADMVTPVLESPINGYFTFAIFPDGSKEGWSDSNLGNKLRDEFVAWLNAKRYEDDSSPYAWVEVQYGDDDGRNVVVRHSDMSVDEPIAQ